MRARESVDTDQSRSESNACNLASSIGLSTEDVRADIFSAEDRMRIVDGTEPASSSRIKGSCYCSPAAAIVRQRKIESQSACDDSSFPFPFGLVCERVWKPMASASSIASSI